MSTDRQRDADLDRLLRATLGRDSAAPPGVCPDAGMLAALVEGGVSAEERAAVEPHLAACGRCQETLAAMDLEVPASSQAPAPAVARKRPWLWRGHLHWLIPVAAASMLVVYLASKPAIAPYFPLGRPAPGTQMADGRTSQLPPDVSVERTAPPTDAGSAERAMRAPAAESKAGASSPQARRAEAAPAFAPEPLPEKAKGEQVAATGTMSMRPAQDVDASKRPAEPATGGQTVVPRAAPAARTGSPSAPMSAAASPAAPAAASPTAPAAAPPPAMRVVVAEAARPASGGLPAGGQTRLTATKGAPPAAAAPPATNVVGTSAASSPVAVGQAVGAETSKTAAKGATAGAAAGAQLKAASSDLAFSAVPSDLVVVSAPGGQVQWRVGPNGGIWRSADEGKTWYPQKSGVKSTLLAAVAPSITACWAVGADGTILLTDDGERWERRPFPEPVDLVAVEARSSHEATVIARDGRRFATTNRGATWIPQR